MNITSQVNELQSLEKEITQKGNQENYETVRIIEF